MSGFGGSGGMGMGGMGGMFNHEDILRSFFNQQRGPVRARDVRYNLDVSLYDLYMGATKNVQIAKPLNNGVSERVKVQVRIDRGMRDKGKVVIKGKIDHVAGAKPGDIVFVVNELPSKQFTRKNDDLATTVKITFGESLTGFRRTIKHLDGRVLKFKSDKGVKDGDVLMLPDEGMPLRSGGGFGKLFLIFEVEMPKGGLTDDQKRKIRSILDPNYIESDAAREDEIDEVRILKAAKAEEFGVDNSQSQFEEEDEPEEQFRGFFGDNPNEFFYQGSE